MNLTGPLGKQYCVVFKLLSLFSLAFAILSVIIIIYNLVTSKNNNSMMWLLLAYIPIYLVGYIQNRLLYNICLQ